jgi:hypothetical protein
MNDYEGDVYLVKYEYIDNQKLLQTNQLIGCATDSPGNAYRCINGYLRSHGRENATIYACIKNEPMPAGVDVIVDIPDEGGSGGGDVVIDPALEITLIGDTDDPENPATWFAGMALWIITKQHRGAYHKSIYIDPTTYYNDQENYGDDAFFPGNEMLEQSADVAMSDYQTIAEGEVILKARAFLGSKSRVTAIGPIFFKHILFYDLLSMPDGYTLPGQQRPDGTYRPYEFPAGYSY